MKMIFLGAPGAGKGTQAELMSRRMGIPTISTGNILRAAVKNGTPAGKQAEAYMTAGKLVPDEIIIGIVSERLAEPDCANGYILDGVPRTLVQAEALEKAGIVFDCVISLEVDDAVIMERMGDRRVCEKCGLPYHRIAMPPKKEGVCDVCGGALIRRKDDAPETVKSRLEIYHRETEPLKGFYEKRDLLRSVQGKETIEETSAEVLRVLGKE